jgi:hypothetical protein
MKISGWALEALLSKLKGIGGMPGFNEIMAEVAPQYRIKPYTLDFPEDVYADSTPSFIIGQFNEQTAEMFGVTDLIKVVMFVVRSSNENYEKPNDFSGVIPVGLDFHLAWKLSEMKQNFELLSLATEDVVSELLQPLDKQNWGIVVYDGRLSATRGVVNKDDQGSFRQKLAFRMTFQLDI